MRKIILAISLTSPIFSSFAAPQRVDFNEHSVQIKKLASECTSKNKEHFDGFCLSQKYGDPQYGDPTQISITVAEQLITFEYFYKKCEHSDFTNTDDLFSRAMKIESAKMFFYEMKPQQEAIETYFNYFNYCKTKEENDSDILKKLKWFKYMIDKYGR